MQITELKLPRIFSFSSSFFMLIQENDLKSVMRAGYVCVCVVCTPASVAPAVSRPVNTLLIT